MSLTFSAGASEIEKLDSNDIYEVAKKLSKGLLMGARGNSGVILSQIFRGVSMAFEGKKEVNAVEFANAFQNGAKEMCIRDSNYGDQFVKIDVKIPTKLSRDEKDLYTKLRKNAKKAVSYTHLEKMFVERISI